MKRAWLAVPITALALAACQTEPGLAPTGDRPVLVIQDGARPGGNPEFFFLPPMVAGSPAPWEHPNWTNNGFNPSLNPTVHICALDAASPSAVTPATPCLAGGYAVSYDRSTNPAVFIQEQRYRVDWRAPREVGIYRITVRVGSIVLGFADAAAVPSGPDFVQLNPGRTLPILFRIESRALCDDPAGTGPCASASVDLSQGGTVSVSTDPTLAPSGVGIPPQGVQQTVTVTVQTCPDLNPRAIDLPTFGTCLTITTDPVLTQLLSPAATVFVCDYPPDVSSLPHSQQELVTLHRLAAGVVQALPHADAACTPPSPSAMAQLEGVLRSVRDGNWKSAGSRLLGLLGPRPLVALDRGGGGLTFEFSDFQFALPAKMDIFAGDGQTGAPGATLPVNPTVRVTDLDGQPVAGARVHFAGTGSVGAPAVVTGANGLAAVSWTLGAPPNTLTASGRGIAGGNADGPRSIFDPFMPIDPRFNPGNDPVPNPLVPVTLQTGTRVFTASTIVVPYGSSGYRSSVIPSGGGPPGWQLPGFDDSGFRLGAAPFGSPNPACALNAAGLASEWPVSTRILVRRTFTLATAANVEVGIAIDNDVRVFLDGVDISNGAVADDLFLLHEGCPARDTFVLRVTGVAAGQHTLAIFGRDRGVSSYLDAEIRLVP